MTQQALTDALHKAAAQNVTAIWQQARAEAKKSQCDAHRETDEARARADREIAALAAQFRKAATARAEDEARRIRTAMNAALAERLYRLAQQALPQFRRQHYAPRFAALARELPARHWQSVRVNPADEQLARTCFADTEVVCDDAVVGGMEVAADEGRIRIDNTLGERLQRAWPEILPRLVASILREHSDHQPAA